MTVKLRPEEFSRALPLYYEVGALFPLVSAVLQAKQRGQVFANRLDSPSAALIVTNFGFTLFVGDERDPRFDAEIVRLLATSGALKPPYLLWYAPPENWRARLDVAGTDIVRRRGRIRYKFCQERAGWLAEPVEWPEGFELRDLSADLISKTEKFGVNLDSRFWASAADFAEHGLGVCLTRGGEAASLCYAAAVADGLAEVDVATDPEFRGRGLAGVVTRQFIKGCLERGIAPTWDCFDYNVGSMKLAEKLGFISESRYPIYSFNVPVEL